MGTIEILKPRLEFSDKFAFLTADIKIDEIKKNLYFRVDETYGSSLVTDRVDSFVAALLILAMERQYDIESEYPISEQLYYNLQNYYIPVVGDSQPMLHQINLRMPTISKLESEGHGVGTGFSGGVDSFYTIVHHQKQLLENYKVTHLFFTSVGTLDNNEERVKKWFQEREVITKQTAEKLNLAAVTVYSNIYQLYPFPYHSFSTYFTTTYASCAFALQKLISSYYLSSGIPVLSFSIAKDVHDCASFDLFTAFCLNNGRLNFYSTGSEVTRLKKVQEISDNFVVQQTISVCGREICGIGGVLKDKVNCSICNKCLRTMSELYAIGELEKFENVFHIESFLKNPGKHLAKTFAMDVHEFNNETISYLKKRGYHFPWNYYLWRYLYFGPKEFLRNIFRYNRLVRFIYFKLNLDLKEHGYRSIGAEKTNEKMNLK